MTDIVGKIGSDAISGFLGIWADSRKRRGEDERTLRRQAAEDMLFWIPALRDLLYRLEAECDRDEWRRVMTEAFASVRRTGESAPHGWNHLRGSLIDAVGNGAGSVVWIELSPSTADGDLTYDHRWTINAAEYLEYLQAQVQRWRNSYGRREAARVALLTYNDWLLRTNRWSPDN